MKLEEIADKIATIGVWGAASGVVGGIGSLGALVVGSQMTETTATRIFNIGCGSYAFAISSLFLMATPEMLNYVKNIIPRKY